VEVRTHRGRRFGTPEESVTPAKQARLIACAEHYLDEHNHRAVPRRIDVMAIEMTPGGKLLHIEQLEDAIGR